MKKIFLDTNIWLRYLLEDNAQAQDCIKLLTKIESGKFKPYTSSSVILEVIYVLTKLYQIPKTQIIDDVRNILTIRNLTLIETTSLLKSFRFISANEY